MENQRGFFWRSLDWAGLRSGAEVQWSLINDQGFHSERKDGQVLTDIQGMLATRTFVHDRTPAEAIREKTPCISRGELPL